METRHFIKTLCEQKVKIFFLSALIALGFHAIKMLKKISLELLIQVETIFKMLKYFYCH